ncbi:hypothetical protein LPJ56_004567 [Coemansia sp. RSA 2599]|nr:hypothetical protein LPJ75_004428 [Coemansia sp. RSA 2598]KAJ1815436.1 hypothetical protein LPJ56_004567 [Coemansia sp. RSA 2599]
MDNGIVDATPSIIRQLMLTRRAVGALKRLPSGKLSWLVKQIGGRETKARCTVDAAQEMGLLVVNRDVRPYAYQSLVDGKSEVERSLFSSDADVLQRLLGEFFHRSQSTVKGNSAQ